MRVRIILLLGIILLLTGCKSVEYVPVPQLQVRDSVVTRVHRDSVYLRDSVYVTQWMAGDTVYRDKVSVRYLYRDKMAMDTLYVYRVDSISVPYPVERRFNYMAGWQWFLLCVGVVAIVTLLCCAVRWMVRARRRA